MPHRSGYTVRHTIETNVANFWELFLDPDVAVAMWKDLGSPGTYEVVEDTVEENGNRSWRIDYTANIELPSFVTKVIGDGAYTEFGSFDNLNKKYSARCVPRRNADRFGSTFEITARELADGRCERVTVVENTVNVFGVGGLIERFLEKTQRTAQDRAADFLNRWIRSRCVAE